MSPLKRSRLLVRFILARCRPSGGLCIGWIFFNSKEGEFLLLARYTEELFMKATMLDLFGDKFSRICIPGLTKVLMLFIGINGINGKEQMNRVTAVKY